MSDNTSRFKPEEEYELEMQALRQQHRHWREWTQDKRNKAGFLMVFSDEFLQAVLEHKVSGNAVKLFLFLGKHADNETGETRVSVQLMEKFFGSPKRTVMKWLRELEDAKLIRRIQSAPHRITRTFMLPYHSRFFEDEERKAASLRK